MIISKCILFILGEAGVGKSFLTEMIKEILSENVYSSEDLNKENLWIIKTENKIIEVEIIEGRNLDLDLYRKLYEETKTFVLYIATANHKGLSLSFTDIKRLKAISETSTVILFPVADPNITKYTINDTIIKRQIPFIEFYFTFNDSRKKTYNSIYEITYLLRRIIINSYSLDYVKELIKINFETKATTLDIGNCGLTSLNGLEEVFQNTHLKELILSNEWGEYKDGKWERITSQNKIGPNVLFSFPKDISKLKNLEIIISGGNWKYYRRSVKYYPSNWHIIDLTPLYKLKKLTSLNVSNNKISSIRLTPFWRNLTKLYLNNNSISNVIDLNKLPKLQELYLSNNQIEKVEFLSSQSQIHTVDLHSNRIKDITPIKDLISRIGIKDSSWEYETISISKNPLSIPPIEVVAKGKQNVINYFFQLEAEREIQISPYINTDIKLIMVGNSNAGKSTYAHWLKTGITDKELPTTHWLDLGVWSEKKGDKSYNIRLFDFGGQEYYHDTHHLFFTNRTAYLLFWEDFSNHFGEIEINQTQFNGNKESVNIEIFPLEYWLDSIRFHTEKRRLTKVEKSITKILDERDYQIEESLRNNNDLTNIVIISTKKINDFLQEEENILVIQNKVDSQKSKSFLNELELKNNYPKIYNFEEISIYQNRNLDLSKDTLFNIIDNLEIVNRQYPGTWNSIKKDIENKYFKKSFSINEFLEYCNEIIKELPELRSKTQAQINKVLFNLEDAEVFASFLTDIGLCLYYPENDKLKEKIFLNHNHILENLNKVLLDINKSTGEISKSGVAAVLGKENSSSEVSDLINLMLHFKILFKHPLATKDSYIAPLYLDQHPPNSILLFQSLFERPIYRFQYETFIHKSIILDFFHTYGSKALRENINDSSFYLWRNGIVIKDEDTSEIVMVKFIPGNASIKSATLDIYSANKTNNIFVKKIVDYVDGINKGLKVKKLAPDESDEGFVPLDVIHLNEREKNQIFYFDKKYYKLTSFKKYLNLPLKMKKIFISYSKQDLRLVNKFIEHLSAMQRDGKVSHWYCSELEAGSVWNDEIQKHLSEADIVCFMISPNFMKTGYIHEHEIKNAFEKKKLDSKFKIVPIILNFCRWTTTNNNLGQFTALPYTAKPVVDFINQDMAWYIIEECLRIMIDNDLDPVGDDFYNGQVLPPDVLKIYTRIVEGKVDNNS